MSSLIRYSRLYPLTACLLFLSASAAPAQQGAPIKIGLPSNMFREKLKTAEFLMPVFKQLMDSQTGIKGEPMILTSADDVGRQLNDGKLQLGVFHGFEYAWAQAKYPDLRPLVIAVSQNNPQLTAEIVVANNSAATKLEDLKDQKVAIPLGTKEHPRLFLFRNLGKLGHRHDKFFKEISMPPNVKAALDDVADGRIQGALVDGTALESYKWLNPANAAKLKTIMKSEVFPPGTIVYKQGGLPETDLKKFKDGLTSAHQSAGGLQLLSLWKLSRFDNVPADYHQSLDSIRRAYPPSNGEEP
jgi:ABC-type phosphate/phosphonate transport system substrate-binding protein